MNHLVCGPLICDVAGLELSQVDKELLMHPKLGGIILFSRNYESREQLADLLRCIREVRSTLFVAVDQEGGRVQRFREAFTVLPPMGQLGALYSVDASRAKKLTRDVGWLMAAELLQLGVDHSFAPVLDLDVSRSRVIGDRAFSDDAEVVISLAGELIDGMNDAGMQATAKHFPGHGGVVADSHHELPVDHRSLQAIRDGDLRPFLALQSRFRALMTAHIVFPEVDEYPVSFSSRWLTSLLRETFAFDGIVFSDDLSMAGAVASGDIFQRTESALAAGCDALLICNQRQQAEQALEYLERRDLGESGLLDVMMGHKQFDDQALASRQSQIHAHIQQYLEGVVAQ